jgi:hypothetical protein
MKNDLKEQILDEVAKLPASEQQRVLEFAASLNKVNGGAARDLARFAGTIDAADLDAMSRAIEDGCEKIEPNAW